MLKMHRILVIVILFFGQSLVAQSQSEERYDTAKRFDPISQSHDAFFNQGKLFKSIDSSFVYIQHTTKPNAKLLASKTLAMSIHLLLIKCINLIYSQEPS